MLPTQAPDREAVGIGAEHRKVADCPRPIAVVKNLPGFMAGVGEGAIESKDPRAIAPSHISRKLQGARYGCQQCGCVIEMAAFVP
ncbi:hypothetical protein StoSoilB5_46340 [Arthrobacter sp. StoSoilB5]|nr:hypothetical protein StoSoilB5_46340 [Arthrobacter sp. StoSoilB5]